MTIEIVTTGGTIDKIYFDAKSSYEIGEPQIGDVLEESNLTVNYLITPLMRKDSLDIDDADRALIKKTVIESSAAKIVITHGTDTMIKTARFLQGIAGKTIVLTGAMQPARFRFTDAIYNIASAITSVQLLPQGVWIAMNGQVFDPESSRKNVEMNRFEKI
ncbi:asparaginase domain-containing protein [uncultured Desulfuromusa sp.]|uniref:asparaginase domain-containing protein n=1 Tax=uncultured Desulfuromusa sp. TaxID=219183 RepID=UPI002AA91671|nr:asparaginase domain-containing protein [uncultured Desulfuromusa sp.]